MGQAAVPSSSGEKLVNQLVTLFAQPLFARNQWQLPDPFLEPVNLDRQTLGFRISLVVSGGRRTIWCWLSRLDVTLEREHVKSFGKSKIATSTNMSGLSGKGWVSSGDPDRVECSFITKWRGLQ